MELFRLIFGLFFDFSRIKFKTMTQGTIARLMDKGYGFISVEGGEKDLFFHANELQNATFDDLQEGDKVEFEVVDGQKGPQAEQVSKV